MTFEEAKDIFEGNFPQGYRLNGEQKKLVRKCLEETDTKDMKIFLKEFRESCENCSKEPSKESKSIMDSFSKLAKQCRLFYPTLWETWRISNMTWEFPFINKRK